MNYNSPHTFHIPVMGLAYTIDSPIKVARFGISSVISIVEDRLVEMMRRTYYPVICQEYHPISEQETDYRAKRITDYLNLVKKIVTDQIEKLRNAAFETGSEIVRYFEMLPEDSTLKQLYRKMMKTDTVQEREKIQSQLRDQIQPGSIDVNIMTKVDRNNYDKSGELMEDGSDAVAALRGYAKSSLVNSSVVFSAGMNPRLYNYLEKCREFDINEDGNFTKKVIIKVSDYRSALIQGKYLAKKGIWVSEFRIESGLNCGGHAFASDGYLMGPILEEFKSNRQELIDTLFEIYKPAIQKKNGRQPDSPPKMIFSAQGGIGTHEENSFLRSYYNIESTGWGTPFLLVPEATTVDEPTLKLLSAAKEEDVVLSHNSPLGVRFYYLKGTSAENEKLVRINKGKPGSPCTEKHLAFNTEFTTEPICTASHKYQKLKIAQLQSLGLPEPAYKRQLNDVQDKECLCVGLSNAAAISYNQTFIKKLNAVNICPGPNIANFSSIVSLQTMTDHIYGRKNILTNVNRPHMFIAELNLYIDYLKEQLKDDSIAGQFQHRKKYYTSVYQNLRNGITYYQNISGMSKTEAKIFLKNLHDAGTELDFLNYQYSIFAEPAISCKPEPAITAH
ncbi:MAG: hypothetical protein HZB42_08660 [Sphingobacteriales bacterium]|nr:hypothetical protein [Sphingobacteriales bacterium]